MCPLHLMLNSFIHMKASFKTWGGETFPGGGGENFSATPPSMKPWTRARMSMWASWSGVFNTDSALIVAVKLYINEYC